MRMFFVKTLISKRNSVLSITVNILIALSFSAQLSAQETLQFTTFKGSGISLYTKPLLEDAYQKLGISIEIQQHPSARALMLSSKGKVDGEVSRLSVIENKYPSLIRIPTAIGKINSAVFTLDRKLKINSWSDIADYRVAVINGYKNSMKKTEGMDRILANTFQQAIELVRKGRVEVAVLTEIDGLRAIKELQIDEVVMLDSFIGTVPLYHYLHQKNEHLVNDVSNAIAEMAQQKKIASYRDQALKNLKAK